MGLPSHPDSVDTDHRRPRPEAGKWRTRALLGLLAVAAAIVLILHLVGVIGPGR